MARRGSHRPTVEVDARVTPGRGIAAPRIELFEDGLGYLPYPGTLNIITSKVVFQERTDLQVKAGKRRYWCWPLTIDGHPGHVVLEHPKLSGRTFLEVVGPSRFRDLIDDPKHVVVRFGGDHAAS